MKHDKYFVLTLLALGLSQSAMATESSKPLPEDWVEWTAVSPGIMERVTDKGEFVRAYQGAEGIAAILLEKQRDLRVAEAAGDIETAETLLELVIDLERLHKVSDSVMQPQGLAKAIQTIQLGPHIPEVCGFSNSGESVFTSNFNGQWDSSSVRANSPGFGMAVQVGPYPPPPYSTFRSVHVKISETFGGYAFTAYRQSTNEGQRITANRDIGTRSGQCHMETTHVYSAHCSTNGSHESAVVTVEQTCVKVRNNLPPVIRINP